VVEYRKKVKIAKNSNNNAWTDSTAVTVIPSNKGKEILCKTGKSKQQIISTNTLIGN
jgi:hypothetical protein